MQLSLAVQQPVSLQHWPVSSSLAVIVCPGDDHNVSVDMSLVDTLTAHNAVRTCFHGIPTPPHPFPTSLLPRTTHVACETGAVLRRAACRRLDLWTQNRSYGK